MWCRCLVTPVAFVLLGTVAQAQDWAARMFPERIHDFGTVARSTKSEFEFKFTNPFKTDVHVTGVRASCGCTTPKITKETLKPNEQGSILAVFNTHSHLGKRQATITVTFDKPQYAEVQLQIRGYVRQDIVMSPGLVQFGRVDQGRQAEKVVEVNYAGRGDWKLLQVEPTSKFLKVETKETQRAAGRVSYQLLVHLNEDAPAGYFSDELTLVTNDRNPASRRVPLVVEGRVSPAVALSPSSLFLGELKPGDEVTRQVVVRGPKPFVVRDVAVDGAKSGFKFEAGKEPANVQRVTVHFRAGEPGSLETKLRIDTDLPDQESLQATIKATVTNEQADK